jgi:hypothetical protein
LETSGGPLVDVATGEIVAVTSGSAILDGTQCLPGSHSYHVPVSRFLDFIDRAIGHGT